MERRRMTTRRNFKKRGTGTTKRMRGKTRRTQTHIEIESDGAYEKTEIGDGVLSKP
jgi:hypothetical protein